VIPEGVRQRARQALDPLVRLWLRLLPPRVPYPPDFTEEEKRLCARVGPYTMTGPERIVALADAVRYVTRNEIPGDIVECGVWRGGSMMTVALTLLAAGAPPRHLYLFDTFEGMPPPEGVDQDVLGRSGSDILAQSPRVADFRPRVDDFSKWALAPGNATFNMWCMASAEDVTANLASTGYPMDLVHLVAGRVEETLPSQAPQLISVLRLDTDWYSSTRHELEHLYDRLAPGGVLILDDYGNWKGSRKAADEFFERKLLKPLLHRIDLTGRCCVKPLDG